jgi:hypothetical protein
MKTKTTKAEEVSGAKYAPSWKVTYGSTVMESSFTATPTTAVPRTKQKVQPGDRVKINGKIGMVACIFETTITPDNPCIEVITDEEDPEARSHWHFDEICKKSRAILGEFTFFENRTIFYGNSWVNKITFLDRKEKPSASQIDQAIKTTTSRLPKITTYKNTKMNDIYRGEGICRKSIR